MVLPFHGKGDGQDAGWTPRGWSNAKCKLVGFEQLLYLRQPGYVVGKAQFDKMLALASRQADATGKPLGLKQTAETAGASLLRGRHLGLRDRPALDHRQRVPRAPEVKRHARFPSNCYPVHCVNSENRPLFPQPVKLQRATRVPEGVLWLLVATSLSRGETGLIISAEPANLVGCQRMSH